METYKTSAGTIITQGSRWKENDPRRERFVVVEGFERRGFMRVVVRTEGTNRRTKADAERFGGARRGHYSEAPQQGDSK